MKRIFEYEYIKHTFELLVKDSEKASDANELVCRT